MAKKKILFLVILSALVLSSCKKEKESETIITSIEEPQISNTTKAIGDTVINKSFTWGSSLYEARIERKADHEVTVKDDEGQKYYDNKITMELTGPDGAIVNKTFCKDNFKNYINTEYIKPKHSVLIGIAFNHVEKGGNAVFVATVGSPDSQSDEYMSIQINIDKSGAMTMSKLQAMDDDTE